MGADGIDDVAPDEATSLQIVSSAGLSVAATAPPGRTLLPAPVAGAISLATRSTSLALRLGTLVGGYGFDAAKFTTLSSLELGRGMLEGILARAGKDTIRRSGSDLARDDAESILEKSLESLHRTMNSLVFWTTAGFHMTGKTMSTVSDVSQLLLTALDQFFGSTDSSRAIASIITLIRRELQNPASGIAGESVSVVDLVLGLCGLAYLQNVCSRWIQDEDRRLGTDEIVWDVVLFPGGGEPDRLHEESTRGIQRGRGELNITSIDYGGSAADHDQALELPERRLRQQILEAITPGSHVSISTSVKTEKIITVDIMGTPPRSLSPPEGVQLIQDSRHGEGPPSTSAGVGSMTRVVYKVNRHQTHTTSLKREEDELVQAVDLPISAEHDSDAANSTDAELPPPVPPKTDGKSQPAGRRRSSASLDKHDTTPPAPLRAAQTSLPMLTAGNSANQKRTRLQATSPVSPTAPQGRPQPVKPSTSRRAPTEVGRDTRQRPSPRPAEKKSSFRSAFKKGPGPAFSNLLHRDDSASEGSGRERKGKQGTNARGLSSRKALQVSVARPTIPPQARSSTTDVFLSSTTEGPRLPPRPMQANAFHSLNDLPPRSSSRASYISIHESRRDSVVSQTDTYSINSVEDHHPRIPIYQPGESRSPPSPQKHFELGRDGSSALPSSPLKQHRRAQSHQSHLYAPSIYTLRTNDSHTSLVPYQHTSHGTLGATEVLRALRRDGMVDATFPRFHLLRNITRYMRFASASYGSNFLRGMGMAKQMPNMSRSDDMHHELHFFAHHTESEASSILLSSFIDQQGGSDGTGATNSGIPLVHYISLDHESKAVVLSCRGTLGFEDVLADLTCDYDQLGWRGKSYKVHKGIHASARRLVHCDDGRVLITLKQALEEFTDYGLVLTGHSLGGAVTSLLGIMLSEPVGDGSHFVTSTGLHTHLLGDAAQQDSTYAHIALPPGRPIHVYAYGPPATMSTSLSAATKGLITSVVNGNDLVPYLSLGVLHDFQAVALAFKSDNSAAKVEVKQRIWEAFQSGLAERWYNTRSSGQNDTDNDAWACAAIKILRANMTNQKLLPPGEVFVVESTQVLRRDAFLEGGDASLERPARRIVLRYVRDVARRFGEVRFGVSMLLDHSPGRYEDALSGLKKGLNGEA